jgi:hypothetical protein
MNASQKIAANAAASAIAAIASGTSLDLLVKAFVIQMSVDPDALAHDYPALKAAVRATGGMKAARLIVNTFKAWMSGVGDEKLRERQRTFVQVVLPKFLNARS